MNNCIFTRSLVVTLFLLSVEKGNKTGKFAKCVMGFLIPILASAEHQLSNMTFKTFSDMSSSSK